ncbi:hypothetical protein [Kibdelosporangium phytohabitans]|uniref:CdiI immunity protein domain-containing protein n=1 Tax=Kibdelosporangium phytohabitans TaxID=860235 RepID=A0A0N9HY17_9PSEU|nr:hypothetical protein [Kibdelosporangium phytohabitans]ALG10332.1 hypothetical protein AOZ06_28625 [Kibdelosporangium phytohabitans]MBE1461374.1 hypothetical protein [Kibdelosporangium phytohabitans]
MEVPEILRARASQPAPPALEQVRSFLRGYIADSDGLDEVRTELTRMAEINRETVRRKAVAIETLLADPPPPGTLAPMVAVDGNWVLDDETSDAAAAAWLADLASLIREVLDSTDR